MPRPNRADEAGSIYQALNRGNARQTIFHKLEDYVAFLRVLGEGLERYPVELFAFTLMPNQGHMVLRPAEDGGMGRMLRWVTRFVPEAVRAIRRQPRRNDPRPLCFIHRNLAGGKPVQ